MRFDPAQYVPEFVAAQIGSPYGKRYFLAHAKQTTGIATINQQVLRAFPLMTPPLHEQEHTAARLTEYRNATERTRLASESQLSIINRLPAALLREAFSGRV